MLFSGTHDQFSGTIPSGTNLQAFVIEFITTFLLMFVISAVATDNRAVKSDTLMQTNYEFFFINPMVFVYLLILF